MARAHVKDGVLRGCPTCGTKVDDAKLALRDFRWVNEALPGKVGAMDVDCVISQASTGRVLMLEMKPPGGFVSRGARLTYRDFVRQGNEVWVVWGPDDKGDVQRGYFNTKGEIEDVTEMPLADLAEDISAWWSCGEMAECL